MVRLPLRSLLHERHRLALRHGGSELAAEGHSPRPHVNGTATRDHETSSAGVERNRPSTHRAGCPAWLPHRYPITGSFLRMFRVGPTTCPLAATRGRAAEQETDRRLLQSIRNSSTLTNDRHPAFRMLFTPGSKRAARAGYPAGIRGAGWLPNRSRRILHTDRSVADSA
jgi:hypothetical protein